jgi:hypothetical protein
MENTGRKTKIPCPEAARLKQIPAYPGKMRAAVSHYAGLPPPALPGALARAVQACRGISGGG